MFYTQLQNSPSRWVVALTIVSLVMSAFPASFFSLNVASAAETLPTTDTAQVDGSNPFSEAIDTSGYENLMLSFDYDAEALDDGDSFTYGWSANAGADGSSTTVAGVDEGGPAGDETDSVSLSLPAAAAAVDFSFFVTATTNVDAPDDFVDVTNITLEGDLLPLACIDQFDAPAPTNIQNQDTGDYFETVDDALADCDTEDGDTIILLADISIDMQITLDREITLDGQGNTISPTFEETDNDNNSAISVIGANNVTVKNLTIDVSGGTSLHGINTYESDPVTIEDVTIINANNSGIVVNGSNVIVRDLTTSGSVWNAINVAQGSGVTEPSRLEIFKKSAHDEAAHIFLDDITQDVTVVDKNKQYQVVYEGPHPNPRFDTTARIYNLKPPKVGPVLECVEELGDDQYRAHFGYDNKNPDTVVVPIGDNNKFTGGGVSGFDQGQGTEFLAGRQVDTVQVDFDGSNLVWTLKNPDGGKGGTATASANSKRCEPTVPQCVNLLENGSFEAEEVTKSRLWDKFASVTGWMIEKVSDQTPTTLELHRGWSGNEAADGEQHVELDGDHATQINQTVSTLEGGVYELSWAFAPRHKIAAEENQLSVLINGVEVATEGPATAPAGLLAEDWTRNSYEFTADSDSTTIGFADAGLTSNSFGTFLDDAKLCLVEEPDPVDENPEVCSEAGMVVLAEQGLTNGGNPVAANRSNASGITGGVSSYANFGGGEGNSWSPTDFYSLGINGTVVYEFTEKIAIDGPGDDIAIWETTGGTGSQTSDEKADVYGSEDGVTFVMLGQAAGDTAFDISGSGLDFVKFVKLVDQSNGVQGNNGDGFDVDAITIIKESCSDFAMVHTEKIVCSDVNELPKWGTGGPDITMNTAADWLAEDGNESCELVDGWEFEYAPKGTSDPGDELVGSAGSDWTTFTGSIAVPLSVFGGDDFFWMREVLQEDYLTFTHGPEGKSNTNDNTAEMYCHTDVKNYDNFDRVDDPEADGDYYCIAWNVPVEKVEMCEMTMVSDDQTVIVENNMYATSTYEHPNWTADIPGAQWIWETYRVIDPTVDTVLTFEETFTVATPTSAVLDIAADNSYRVFINDVLVVDRSTVGNNFQSHTQKTYSSEILNALVSGENMMRIEVTNTGVERSNDRSNPAGLLYKLVVNGVTECDVTTEPEPDEKTYTISGYKWNDTNGDGVWDRETEFGIEDWIIYLDGGETTASTTTQSDGSYSFEVTAGMYEVYEEQREGWVQTAPTTDIESENSYGSCTYSFGEDVYEFRFALQDSYILQDGECNFGNQLLEDDEDEDEDGNNDDSNTQTGTLVRSSSNDGPQQQVLGATTAQICPFLNDYMQIGIENDPWEVTKLQVFLSLIMGYENPITGEFGGITDANVKLFQALYADEILTPWFEAGIVPHNDPTGFVYKTTLWKINDIMCPGLMPFPGFEGEDLSVNVDID